MKNAGSAFATALAALACGGAGAQGVVDSYPSKPVTIIVSVAPGASTDFEARLYASKLSEQTGKSFVTDYKIGAGTTIGNAYVAKSAPDGYTLLIISPSFTVAPLSYPELPYDNERDFAPVSLMSKRGSMFIVHPSLPVKSMTEYFAYARANPGKVNIGTSGPGGVGHMSLELLHLLTKTKATFVHYKGGAPAYAAILKGEVDATYGGPTAMLQHVNSGKVRVLAFTTLERARMLPDVPTVSETVPGFEYSLWLGLIAPAATPVPIINKLSAELAKVAKAPDVVQKLEGDGALMVGSSPEVFRKHIAAESARWKKTVQETGIKPGE